MNGWQRFEYVTLRVARRHFLPQSISTRMSRWLPYYNASVNEANPMQIVAEYRRLLSMANLSIAGRNVMEIGAGRTNLVARAIRLAGARNAYAMEPFVSHDHALEHRLIERQRQPWDSNNSSVERITSFQSIADGSIDLVLSNSVLEHVRDLRQLLTDLKRILSPAGVMLHLVDYRDHFFKYPFGFLTFTSETWTRWLDPGDLPRWRISDHIDAMKAAGLSVEILDRRIDLAGIDSVRKCIRAPFDRMPDETNAVTYAALLNRPHHPAVCPSPQRPCMP